MGEMQSKEPSADTLDDMSVVVKPEHEPTLHQAKEEERIPAMAAIEEKKKSLAGLDNAQDEECSSKDGNALNETNNHDNDGTSDKWLAEAVELWMGRGLRQIAKQGYSFLEIRLAAEAKKSQKLRPNDYPPCQEYVKRTVEALRKDPRLAWTKVDKGILYFDPESGPPSESESISPKKDKRELESAIFGEPKIKYAHTSEKEPSPQNQELNELQVIQQRIYNLVRLGAPLDASQLPQLYKEEFGRILDYKKMGFKKMSDLIDGIPEIEIVKRHCKGSPPVVLVLKEDETVDKPTVDESKTPSSTTFPTQPDTSNPIEVTELRSCSKQVSGGDAEISDLADILDKQPVVSAIALSQEDQAPHAPSQESTLTDLLPNAQSVYDQVQGIVSKPIRQLQAVMGGKDEMAGIPGVAFLGSSFSPGKGEMLLDPLFLNTHNPFSLAMVGVSGSGKSSTLSCVLESCLLDSAPADVVRLEKSMTAVVLYYDPSGVSYCKVVGMLNSAPNVFKGNEQPCVSPDRATILVSPTFYKQRKQLYGNQCLVRPLLFRWKTLTPGQIKQLMGIDMISNENCVPVASLMALLRRYQRHAVVPHFPQFLVELKQICSPAVGASCVFDKGIALLETFVAESQANAHIVYDGMDICQVVESEQDLVIVDLTDPLLTSEEANSVFQVVTETFQRTQTRRDKVLAVDGAHYFMGKTNRGQMDGLNHVILNLANQRHDNNIRLILSTETPLALMPELWETMSAAILHHFYSESWWDYLCSALPLSPEWWETVLSLGCRNALVVSPSHSKDCSTIPVAIRCGLTCGGSTTYESNHC